MYFVIMYFVLITDKIREKYIAVKTLFIEALEYIFIQQAKDVYLMQIFSDRFNDRLERIKYIGFLCKLEYKFKYYFFYG